MNPWQSMIELRPDQVTPRWVAVVLVGATLFFAVGITGGSHFNSDDALYAQMAREMVQTGNWLDNQWSGVVLFEKPPLYLWSLAFCGSAFGWSELSMRLPGTLFGVFGVLAMFLLCCQLGSTRRQAVTGAALMACSYLFLMLTRRLMMDVPMLCCVLWASWALVSNRIKTFGVLSGLAVLAKGVAAGPLLLVPVIYGGIHKQLTWQKFGIAFAIGVGVAAPWHLIQTIRHGGEFWAGYLGHHVAERAVGQVVPGLTLLEMLRALSTERILLLLGLAGIFPALLHSVRRRQELFALIWFVCALIPILFVQTRLPHYLLPLAPALAMFSFCAFPRTWWEHRLAPGVATFVVSLFIIAPVVAFPGVDPLVSHPDKASMWLSPNFDPNHKELGIAVEKHSAGQDTVGTYNLTSSALTFYANRRFTMYTDQKRFHSIQNHVLMIRRAGVLQWLDGSDSLKGDDGSQRFIVARKVDEESLVSLMRSAVPGQPLHVLVEGNLVLVNDAGLGQPVK